MNYKYSKASRLLTKKDFLNLKQGSLKVRDPYFICYYKPSLTTTRLGLSISTSNLNSVRRNRLKRLLREKFRHHHTWKTAFDFLIVIKAMKPITSFDKFEKDITCSFNKLLINLSSQSC